MTEPLRISDLVFCERTGCPGREAMAAHDECRDVARAAVDPPGTCHLVGCPTKGTVDEHAQVRIGCPDAPGSYTQDPTWPRGQVIVASSLLVRADSLLSAFLRGRVVSLTTVPPAVLEEARTLSEAFRRASAGR